MQTQNVNWVEIPDVPIFDAHLEWTEEDLRQVVENNNQRIRSTNDKVPLLLGHTADEKTEAEQGLIVGYASDFYLGVWDKENPHACIFCKFQFYPDLFAEHDIMRQYPRRSVEIWSDDKFIDPIALLKNTPQRPLGLLGEKFQKKYRYSATYQQGEPMDQKEEFIRECYSKLQESEEFAFVRQLMSKAAEEAKPEDDKPEEDKAPEAEPEKHSAEEDNMDQEDKDADKDRLQKDQLRSNVEKFKKENDQLKEQFTQLQRKFRRAERERDLVRMETVEGVDFDLAEELEIVQDLDEAGYQKHLDRMRKVTNVLQSA